MFACDLEQGMYQVHVRTDSGQWVASETLQVFDGSTSVGVLGKSYEFKL